MKIQCDAVQWMINCRNSLQNVQFKGGRSKSYVCEILSPDVYTLLFALVILGSLATVKIILFLTPPPEYTLSLKTTGAGVCRRKATSTYHLLTALPHAPD